MSSNYSDPSASNLVGLWDFEWCNELRDTGLADGVAQNGEVHGNASFSGGRLHLDGYCDYFETSGDDDPFDLSTGTISVQFTQDCHVGSSPDTIVNRGEYNDMASEGYFGIQVTKDGRVEVIHCPVGADSILRTDAGFFDEGDTLDVVYSWDEDTGATLKVVNESTGESVTVSSNVTGLTMDIGDNDDENFTFGAREYDDGCYDRFFDGSIDYVAIHNIDLNNPTPVLDGIVEGTDGADIIDANYEGDPEGDKIDNSDAILPGEAPQDDIVLAGAGNDTVYAGQGNDDVYGGDGADRLYGQAGDDLIYGGDGNDMIFGGQGDDVLRGGNGDDKIEASAGDDCVEGGAGDDDLWGGIGNDQIDGGSGNDTINAGAGADAVYAGSGDDTVQGGDGNDVIYGDSSKPGVDGGDVVRESFEWNLGTNANLPQSFTQDTGNAKVTFSTLKETGNSNTIVGTDAQNVSDIDTGGESIDHCSSLDNILNGEGNEADYRLGFDKAVSNVAFRINDVDGDGVVRVTAYDADGNKVHVDLTGGDRLTLLDTDGIAGADTADSDGGYLPDTSDEYSLLVEIPGPITRIEIEHEQNGSNNSGINITDVYFDVTSPDTGVDGNDTLLGGAGNDIVYGEGGDDEIDGGAGNDEIYGGVLGLSEAEMADLKAQGVI